VRYSALGTEHIQLHHLRALSAIADAPATAVGCLPLSPKFETCRRTAIRAIRGKNTLTADKNQYKMSPRKEPTMIQNKVALITGAARGIGHGVAIQLASEGYAIAIMDVLAEDQVKENIDKVKSFGTPVLYINGNITSDESRKTVLQKIDSEFGRLDVLVNNAGVAPKVRLDILATTEESFDFVLGINLKGTFFLTQLVANYMVEEVKKNVGIAPIIVNISSISAYVSSTMRGEYCISKAGISMITALFADRLAEYGINVYEIRPGIIATDMTAGVKEKYDRLILEEGILPIRRWGTPDDIAHAVSVLCSGKLAYSTGEVLNVDGGFHIRRL
jgi:NAD(P)-dependent dehydrogenase (short-subunit alcohol dehydrogenase family)